MDEKKKKLCELKQKLIDTHSRKLRAERIYKHFLGEWEKLKKECEKLDYELAMVDGRYKKVEQGDSVIKEKKAEAILSPSQIMSIAEALGIVVDIGDLGSKGD